MVQDTSQIKEKIISVFKRKGPSLPVHIAREIELSMLFTSAFLSELLNENRLKISNMRVGNSPVYYIQGQENQLENYAEHIKGKEKEAYLMLKENNFLKDNEMEPAIRVALRSIKDFAVPFRKDDEIYWRYYLIPESDFEEIKEEKSDEIQKTDVEEKSSEKPLEIFDQNAEDQQKEISKKPVKKTAKRAPSKTAKKNEKFLEKVREFLAKSSIDILSIEGIRNDELTLKIRANGGEQLLVAYNKKRITEKEILKAHKKAYELGLKYSVLSMGELPRKISDMIEALKNIKDIGKVE